jgi:monovalent cation:proton antiporter-2 (CPA2) family protein
MPFLTTLVILLAAAVLAVPLVKRMGFGSVLGYLLAGLVIGPSGLHLVSDVESVAEVSELGVVMLLFLIGLELRPARLWVMRRTVIGMGAAQVGLCGVALAGLVHLAGLPWVPTVVIGFGLALSSTAIVLPILGERDLLSTQAGRDSFAVLLFQDMAFIPMVALVPLLAGDTTQLANDTSWVALVRAGAVILLVLLGGRFLVRPIFRAVAGAKVPEIFTATTLLVVVGTAALASTIGLSTSLGAFVAGVLLSDSEYRHEIQADIEPFQGLLLGFFFVSVGMSTDVSLALRAPALVLAGVGVLLAVKAAIAFVLARISGRDRLGAIRFALALAGAGEFGFVLFTVAVDQHAMSEAQSNLAQLVITLSMIAGPILFAVEERWVAPLFGRAPKREFDEIKEAPNPVIICGFGRVGQIIGRVLRMRGIPFTALDNNPAQIDLVRRAGSQAYYGNPTRLDLLRSAGAAEAKILVVALDDVGESLQVIQHVKRHFPQLVILARARNRRHVHLLMDLGVRHIVRETFHSSLQLTAEVLEELGLPAADIERTIRIFRQHDEATLEAQHAIHHDEKQLLQTARQAAEELQELFTADRAGSGEAPPQTTSTAGVKM